jgi:tRNA G18 (ribose-2'-O)-methylase SpoU
MPIGDRKLTMDELGRVAPEAYVARSAQRVRVVLDDVRSRHNVGSVFRTADGFGIEGIILCGFTPVPPHREIEKTALGATGSVPWEHVPDARSAIERLRAEGYHVIAVEQTVQAQRLQDLVLPSQQPVALVFGNELHGVSDPVIAACDECVVVPQFGSKHSLNISVCAGVVLWWLAGRTR